MSIGPTKLTEPAFVGSVSSPDHCVAPAGPARGARWTLREAVASLEERSRGIAWADMAALGSVYSYRTRQGKPRWVVDVRPYGLIYSDPQRHPFEEKRDAERALAHIQGELWRGRTIEEVLAPYLPKYSKTKLVPARLEAWLRVMRERGEAGDLSPTYLRELERYGAPEGHFSWWADKSVHEVDYGHLEDWTLWLADRGLSAKTRWNVVGAFSSFLGWLRRRGEITQVPEIPWPKLRKRHPRAVSLETQQALLEAIREGERGIFLCMGLMGVRPSEAMALEAADYEEGWLRVGRARKGRRRDAPIRAPKDNEERRLPVPSVLREWIGRHVPPAARLARAPLFANPRTAERWLEGALKRRWSGALKRVGAPRISLYAGTKHTFATHAVRAGVPELYVQKFLGHSDLRSTRKYVEVQNDALLEVLAPRRDKQATSRPPTRKLS